jgi:hypothetical protein
LTEQIGCYKEKFIVIVRGDIMGFFNYLFKKDKIKDIKKQQEDEERRKEEELKRQHEDEQRRRREEIKKQQEEEERRRQEELKRQQEDEERRKQEQIIRQQKLLKESAEFYELEKEIKEIKKEIRRENSYNKYNHEPIQYIGYCNFLIGDYCSKYDFSPVLCGPKSNEYGCTWKERRLTDFKIKVEEDISFGDIMYEKRLTMFGEFYYDRERFNIENYQDMQDFYEYLYEHMDGG